MRPSVSVYGPGNPAEQHPSQKPRYGYLTPKQAAEFTNISVQELERRRREGGGPKFCPVGSRLVRYPVDELCADVVTLDNAFSDTAERRKRLRDRRSNVLDDGKFALALAGYKRFVWFQRRIARWASQAERRE